MALSNQSLTEAAMEAPHAILSTAILPFVSSIYPVVGEPPFDFPFEYDVPEASETTTEIPSDKLLKLLSDFGLEDSFDALPEIQIMRPTIRGASTNKFTFAVNGEEWDCDLIDGESVLIRPQQNFFHNPASPTDINADGETTPLDALIVVNILNDRGSYFLPNRVTNTSNFWKLDPSGDFEFTPLDLLYVFDQLHTLTQSRSTFDMDDHGDEAFTDAPTLGARLAYPIDADDKDLVLEEPIEESFEKSEMLGELDLASVMVVEDEKLDDRSFIEESPIAPEDADAALEGLLLDLSAL